MSTLTRICTLACLGGLIVTVGFAGQGIASAEESPPISLPPNLVIAPTTAPTLTITPDIVISVPPTTDPVVIIPSDPVTPTTQPSISVPVDISIPPPTTEPTITVPVDVSLPPDTTIPAFDVITLPSAPQSPSAKPGTQSITVTWYAPASTGGAAIDHYQVQRATDVDSGEWTDLGEHQSTSFTNNTGLTVGERYYYRVRAHNVAGYGAWSGVVSARPYTFPSAPLYLEAAPVKNGVVLTWDAPLSDGLSPLVGYHVSVFTNGCEDKVDDIYILGSTTLDNTRTYSVEDGTAHCFRVQAGNQAGFGPYSNHAIAVAGRPSAPEQCSLIYQDADEPYEGYAYASWEEPASMGGYGGPAGWVEDYVIRYTDAAGDVIFEAELWDNWHVWDGPPAGSWRAEISARNSEGEGVACTTSYIAVD
jgi:hypothetical protein